MFCSQLKVTRAGPCPPPCRPCLDAFLFMFPPLSSRIISFGIFIPSLWEFIVTTDGVCQC